jgi:hypothetical protein
LSLINLLLQVDADIACGPQRTHPQPLEKHSMPVDSQNHTDFKCHFARNSEFAAIRASEHYLSKMLQQFSRPLVTMDSSGFDSFDPPAASQAQSVSSAGKAA